MFRFRLLGALAQYERHADAHILVQGGFGHFNKSPEPSAVHAQRFLVSRGVNEHDIWTIHTTMSTVTEALSSWRFVQSHPASTVSVVTSHVHLRRSRVVFEHFFDPETLTLVGTENGVPDSELPEWERHEQEGLALLRKQGGVKLEGRLFPTPDPLAGQF